MSLRWSTTLIVAAVAIVGAVLWISGVLPGITGWVFGGAVVVSLVAGIAVWIAGASTNNGEWRQLDQALVLGAVLGFVGGFVSCFALITNYN